MASPQACEPSLPSPDDIHPSFESGYGCLSSEFEGSGTRNPSAPIAVEIRDDDLFHAARSDNTCLFRTFSPEQLSRALSLRDEDGRSLLHAAISFNRIDVVRFLAEADPSRSLVNGQDKKGFAPIHSACCLGHHDIVELLCVNGADVNLKNLRMDTPLHIAADFGRLKVAQFLISFGAEINAKNKVGCIPLHRAADEGALEICELLISTGSEIDAVDQADQTPLTHAVICDHKEIALLLIRYGANMADKVEYEMLGRYPADYKDGESKPRNLKKPRRPGPVRLSGCSPPMNYALHDPGLLTGRKIREIAKDALSSYNKKRGLSRRGCGYKLVKALGGIRCGFSRTPCVHHLNFIARLKRRSEAENKLFFAEVKLKKDHGVASSACSIIGPTDTETGLRGCEICKNHPYLIQHPRRKNGFTKAL